MSISGHKGKSESNEERNQIQINLDSKKVYLAKVKITEEILKREETSKPSAYSQLQCTPERR